jgi:tetratricopeptide (TPR) repeat protein
MRGLCHSVRKLESLFKELRLASEKAEIFAFTPGWEHVLFAPEHWQTVTDFALHVFGPDSTEGVGAGLKMVDAMLSVSAYHEADKALGEIISRTCAAYLPCETAAALVVARARCWFHLGRYGQAEAYLTTQAPMYGSTPLSGSLLHAEFFFVRALNAVGSNDRDATKHYALESLQIYNLHLTDDHPRLLKIHSWLATGIDDDDEAISIHHQIIDSLTATIGPSALQTLTEKNNLACRCLQCSRVDTALVLLADAESEMARLKRGNHDVHASLLNNLANAHAARGEHQQAYEAMAKAHKMRVAIFGPNHVQCARDAMNLAALILHVKSDFPTCRAMIKQALVALKRELPAGHPFIEEALKSSGVCCLAWDPSGREMISLSRDVGRTLHGKDSSWHVPHR